MSTNNKLRFYVDIIKPYLYVFIPYFLALLITLPFYLFFRAKNIWSKVLNPNQSINSLLCLEAGVKGWQIIEYQELYKSAIEYVGEERLLKFTVTEEKSYLRQLKEILDNNPVTHYGWSPRTGEQERFKGLIEAFKIAIILSRRGIVPIVFLTDVLDRSWRAKASVVTASMGIVVTLNSPDSVTLLLPHKRFIGPYLMPFSETTLKELNEKKQLILEQELDKDAVVVGALYEPRKTIVENVDKLFHDKTGKNLIFNGRSLDGKRSSDAEYWESMYSAKIVLTTASVVNTLDGYDWAWKEHFIYRYMETLACETLLVAPELPAIQRYFNSGEHFISFASEEDAAQKIQYYLDNDAERKKIAYAGFKRAQSLVQSRSFWLGIDIALAGNGMTR